MSHSCVVQPNNTMRFDGDVTFSPLTTSWRIGRRNANPPNDYAIFEFGQEVDWTHMNALDVLASEVAGVVARRMVYSLMEYSEIGEMDLAGSSLLWRLNGRQPGMADITTLTSSVQPLYPKFSNQHDLQYLAEGDLLMFDNHTEQAVEDGLEYSRAIRLTVDTEAMSADLGQSWPVTDTDSNTYACSEQGSARLVPTSGDANVLESCEDVKMVAELTNGNDDVADAAVFTLKPTLCGNGNKGFYRAFPLYKLGTF